MSIGVPIKLIYEGMGHIVTVEVRNGETLRGRLANVEDTMNILLESVTCTHRGGRQTQLEQVFVRGSQIRLILFPDMLRHSPMFKLALSKNKNRALGIGKQRRAMVVSVYQQQRR